MSWSKYVLLAIFVFSIILSSGCVKQDTSSNSFMKIDMGVEHPSIFAGGEETFYSDITNDANKDYNNFVFTVFDAPFFKGTCEKKLSKLNRKSHFYLECKLTSDELDIPKGGTSSSVSMATNFDGVESMYQQIETISQEEFFRNKVQTKPSHYSTSDGYIEIDSDFQSELPIVYTKDRNYTVLFKIKNVGPGVIDNMSIDIIDKNGILKKCNPEPKSITYEGGNEVTFGCIINPPVTKVLNSQGVIINVDYKYKIIKNVIVEIKR